MSKIASKIIAVVVTLLLAISFVVTGAFMQTISKLAAADPAFTIETGVTNRVKYGEEFTVAKGQVSVKTPGGTFATVKGSDTILDGKTDLSGDAIVEATQVGVYEITYAADQGGKYASYTYNVEVYMDYEYLFVVDGYGASIPTYWEKSGPEITLPSATLYYYNEDLEKYLPDQTTGHIYCKVTKPGAEAKIFDKAALDAGTSTVDPDIAGMYFMTYYAEVANGDNLFSEEYTMQVQSSFSDSKAPTLSISDVGRTSSSNTEIKLPTATVSDDYDTRVNTTITVRHDYGSGLADVPEVVVDKDTGFAAYNGEGLPLYYKAGADGARYAYEADGITPATTTKIAEAASAIFDNNNFMSFYPTDDGQYKVTYSAMDSTGKYGDNRTSNKTADFPYTVNVSDTTAPVIKKMDESLIPSNWGLSVYQYSESEDKDSDGENITEEIENTDIQFPIPELSDNKDGDDALGVSFTLSDKKSKTVMSFTDIYSDDAADARYAATGDFSKNNPDRTYYFYRYWNSRDYLDAKFTVSETDGKITQNGSSYDFGDNAYMLVYYDAAEAKVTKGFFNFSMWNATDALGQYTATYRVKDAAGNNTAKRYNINLESIFEDTTLPSVDFNEPDYLTFRKYETEQSITDVSATDSNDARLDVKYYLIFNMSFEEGPYKTGDKYDFDKCVAAVTTESNLVELDATLGTNKLKLESKNNGFYVTVDNKEGEEKEILLNNLANTFVYVAMKATDSAGNTSSYMKSVKTIDGTTATGKTYAPTFGTVNTAPGEVGKEYNFGSFYVEYANVDDRAYTGFEVYVQRVQDADDHAVKNAPLTNVSFETYSDNRTDNGTDGTSTRKLHVDNIRFTPSRGGTYMLVARGFHVSGAGSVAMFFIDVEGNEEANVPGSAVLGDKLDYNTTYSLPDDYKGPKSWAGDKVGVLRSITGGRFALMGSEFTAKATTTYNFSDYTFEYNYKIEQGKKVVTEFENNSSENNGVAIGSLVKYNYVGGVTGVCYGKQLAKDLNSKTKTPLIAGENESVGNYSTTISDTKTATFRLLGVMPTYSEITTTTDRAFVTLPNISASSVNGNATDIKCVVINPDGTPVKVYKPGDKTIPKDYKETLVGNQFMFEATDDGKYTVTYTATLNNQPATAEYTITAGDVIAPSFNVGAGYINDIYRATGTSSASVNDRFDFASITVTGDEPSMSDLSYSKKLISPEGETVAEVKSATKKNNGSSIVLTLSGSYKVVYTVTDAAGNATPLNFYITVTSSASNVSTEAITTLSVVLIVVGVLLIAGIIIYLVRFRKRKSAKK